MLAGGKLDFCSFSCSFCWRSFGKDRFKAEAEWDDPKTIIDGAIAAQQELLSGFGGNEKTTKELFGEAMEPAHFAISLDGEPTLYPRIVDLIKEIKNRNCTAFIVSNGTMPNRLKEMLQRGIEPTNLYVSVYATNPEDYKKITNSFIFDAFEKVRQSLELLKDFKEARTVFRITAVKDLNMKDPEGFAELIKFSEADFVEVKGYSYVGESRERLAVSNMPSMQDNEDFSKQLAELTGYTIKTKDLASRLVVLVKDDETWKWSLEKIKEQDRLFDDASKKKA